MHEHLSRELFRAIHKGWRNPGDLAAIAMAHLFVLCPHCRSEFEAWRGELGEGVARDEGDYDGALQKIRERTVANDDPGSGAEEVRVAREKRKANSRAKELLALPDDQRIDWIRSEKHWHSGLLLAEALIEECRRRTVGSPYEAFVLADLARVVLHHAPVNESAVELYALALARLANTIRVIGDLPRAEQVMGDAKHMLRVGRSQNRALRAEIDGMWGSLRVTQNQFESAVPLLLQTLMSWRLLNEPHQGVGALLKLSNAHAGLREHERVFVLLDEADEILARAPDAVLNAMVDSNRIRTLLAVGQTSAALDRFARFDRETLDCQGSVSAIRNTWLESTVKAQARDYEGAEALIHIVLGFLEDNDMQLDLADARVGFGRILESQGRLAESGRMVSQAIPVFEQCGTFRELAGARRLLERVSTA